MYTYILISIYTCVHIYLYLYICKYTLYNVQTRVSFQCQLTCKRTGSHNWLQQLTSHLASRTPLLTTANLSRQRGLVRKSGGGYACFLTQQYFSCLFFQFLERTFVKNATLCNTLQLSATLFNALQHTATLCNALQHIATHCNTL